MLATNTSSISITRLGAATDRPERFIGLHFMNPVPLMKLVEVIRGLATDQQTYETAVHIVERLNKHVTNAEDFPAFIVNRVLMPMINEAVYTLYEGVGTVESIDTAMKLGANHPMGPLELADFIGLDTCLSIMQVLHDGLADTKYRPCPLLVKYVEAGWVGKKAGRGFYDYRGEKAGADALIRGARRKPGRVDDGCRTDHRRKSRHRPRAREGLRRPPRQGPRHHPRLVTAPNSTPSSPPIRNGSRCWRWMSPTPLEIARVRRRLEAEPIDVLINNAGISGPDRQSATDMDFDGLTETFNINTMRPCASPMPSCRT
jgi:hypothetical protein